MARDSSASQEHEMTLSRSCRFILALVLAAVPVFLAGCSSAKGVSKEATGYLDSEGTVEEIAGWAWDPTQPDTPIKVDILVNDKVLSSVLADMYREDLAKDGKGNGKHGFLIPFPEQMRDGKTYTVKARVADVNIELQDSPRALKWGERRKSDKNEGEKPPPTDSSKKLEKIRPDKK
jgi:hypothetical protein